MKDVTAFGEMMLRLSVPQGDRLAAMRSLDVHAAGAESNVLAALASLGRSCGWFGALPTGPIGDFAARQQQLHGIDMRGTRIPNSRLGTYYVEFAGPPRPIQVIYDRAHAAITTMAVEDVDYDRLLDTRIVHLSGITPPLGGNCMAIMAEIIRRANAAGVAISFDVNYRQKLWSEAEAGAQLRPLLQGIDLLLCSQRDAAGLFGCSGSAEEVVNQLQAQTGAKQIVVTLADAGVIAWDGASWHRQSAREVEIVDRIGAGDALAAGVIHGWLDGDIAAGLEMGTLLAALVLGQHGDMLVTSPEEVAALLESGGGGLKR